MGAPVEEGTNRGGCMMGPDAFRTAGLVSTIAALGYNATDLGNARPVAGNKKRHPNPAIHDLERVSAWARGISEACHSAASDHDVVIVLGGDHSVSAGSIPVFARRAAKAGRPFFTLWLDAHPDLHRLNTTESGNLHGTSLAYALGRESFDGYFPELAYPLDPKNLCILGLRSVDNAEHALIQDLGLEAHDMRAIDEHGIKTPLAAFLERVKEVNGQLHVSLDVDFLDPDIACAVGTTVPGGVTFREAHLVMELLYESGCVTSLDLVELNPFLDDRGRTARLMVDLTASLFGRRILDRPTSPYTKSAA